MRPIRRDASPIPLDFDNYADAKADLVSRLGPYCSFCERHICTQLAVEHIQPKGLPQYKHLIGRWGNFLLACVNCNSTKGSKEVTPENYFLPDRDNTFLAFRYREDGTVEPSAVAINAGLEAIATATLKLTGLDKVEDDLDQNAKQVALRRMKQRMETWLEALDARQTIETDPLNVPLRLMTTKLAAKSGFFSIWMTVFSEDQDMRQRLLDAFPGTRASECFCPSTGQPISPAGNPDQLDFGAKI